ncbi:unnamed protein product [Strongylus vulgaris]|uniref:Uncharacterized protein n=1 Tax=Strongylus vulgaris TaxID=40348 RepID=A0A3P7IAJ1_STRVU|nr:unnamed protein product [Strongylus vulgaris]
MFPFIKFLLHSLFFSCPANDNTIRLSGKVLNSEYGRLIEGSSHALALLTSRSLRGALQVGDVTKVTEETSIPVLCSYAAKQLPSYIPKMVDRLRKIGFPAAYYKDNSNKTRPFIIFREPQMFTMGSKFQAGKIRNDVCKEKVNMVMIEGERNRGLAKENLDSCNRDAEFETYRSSFKIFLPDGEQPLGASELWRSGHPDRTCGITPRVGLGFSQEGLVDIPAVARLFVICTFGEPSKIKQDESAFGCHKYALYDKQKGHCSCKDGYPDIKNTKLFDLTEAEKSHWVRGMVNTGI